MALAKTSNEILSIRGRCGGIYFKKDNYGQHIQTMPRAIRKASMQGTIELAGHSRGNRLAYINSWTHIATIWAMKAAYIFLIGFLEMAEERTSDLTKSKGKKLTGWNWFTHLNVPRVAEGLPPYTYPPRGADPRYGDQDYKPWKLPTYTIVGKDNDVETIGLYPAGYGGTHKGKPYYLPDHYKSNNVLWWDDDRWILSSGISEFGQHWWMKMGDDPTGIYDPLLPEDGTKTVNF